MTDWELFLAGVLAFKVLDYLVLACGFQPELPGRVTSALVGGSWACLLVWLLADKNVI